MSSQTVDFTYINVRGWKTLKRNVIFHYGLENFQKIRKLEQLENKLIRLEYHIGFQLRCKRANIVPKGLRMKNRFKENHRFENFFKTTSFKLLKEIIRDNFQEKHHLVNELRHLKTSIRTSMPEFWGSICRLINNSKFNTSQIIQKRQDQKWSALEDEKYQNTNNKHKRRNDVVNLSKYPLQENEFKVLQLGLNYALPTTNKSQMIIETAIAVDEILARQDETKVNEVLHIRKTVSRILQKEKQKPDPKPEKWMSDGLNSLRSNEDICIAKADKGNVVVVMDVKEYEEKMNRLINEGPYAILNQDPTPKCKNKCNKILKRLVKEEKITQEKKNYLLLTNPTCPVIYGAPKIHKPLIPFRPVVDCRGSPTYRIAKDLKPILQCLIREHPYTIQNSYEFVDKLKKMKTSRQHVQVSFDVESLFTQVPIKETLEITKQLLQEKPAWRNICKLDEEDVIELLELCMTETNFQFRNNYYRQNEGMAMGSPISPIMAEIFMQHLETTKISQIQDLKNWLRFVDDGYGQVNRRKLEYVKDQLNNIHPKIKFTMEVENTNNHSLPFLDILVTRKEDGSFGHQIYRKPTHSDKYLHFTSAHPLCHKISAIDSLHYRALKLSDAENLKDELNHIKQTFIANGYPGYMVDASLQKMKIRVDSPPQSTDSQSKGRLILPWFNNTSNRIGGVIREELNVDIGYIPGRKISSFLCNTKDKRPKAEVGVYKIPCKENCQDIYVGETSRSLKIRVKEHQKDVEQAKTEESAVAGHVFEKEHHVDFGNASLVERETRTYNRLFKEGLYIRKAPNVMNRNNGMEIHEDWLDLLLPLTKTP
ncbi:unnamed protein product [Orchesella dallaii]|uniref:Reverse transcriptase domain-containing protein n=1 Tax=Orchesella dallaii TaxID=48710 RepID=A0ABP1QM20_9HEXA